MSKVIDIQLYRSYQKTGAIKATGIRKVFTSMLIVLLIISGGIGMYFYYSSKVQQAAVEVTPPKPKPKIYSLSQQVAGNLAKWIEFSGNILNNQKVSPVPRTIISDIDPYFLAEFLIPAGFSLDSISKITANAGRIVSIIDTLHQNGKLKVIVRARIPKGNAAIQPMPVKKYLRATVINWLDSLAQSKGLTPIDREPVSAEQKVKGGTVFMYRQVIAGSPDAFVQFARGVKELKYAVAPVSFMYDLSKNPAEYNIIWGLYDYQQPATGKKTSPQTAKK